MKNYFPSSKIIFGKTNCFRVNIDMHLTFVKQLFSSFYTHPEYDSSTKSTIVAYTCIYGGSFQLTFFVCFFVENIISQLNRLKKVFMKNCDSPMLHNGSISPDSVVSPHYICLAPLLKLMNGLTSLHTNYTDVSRILSRRTG